MVKDAWPAKEGIEKLEELETIRAFTKRAFANNLHRFNAIYCTGKEEETVLEIGSGLGYLANNWSANFKGKWIQLEAQEKFLEIAKKRDPTGLLVQGSIYELPFPDNTFDIVGGLSSFDVFSNLETALNEVKRVLKPNGFFFHVLDMGADYEIMAKDFRKKRIPFYSTRKTDSLLSILSGSNQEVEHYYIPTERIPSFLTRIGMTQEEMDAKEIITGDFGFDALIKSINKKEKRKDRNEFEDIEFKNIRYISTYFTLFQEYAKKINTNDYFNDKLQRTLQNIFGENNTKKETIIGEFKGKRTKLQKERYPYCIYYEKNGIKTNMAASHKGIWDYIETIIPRIFNQVHEKAIIDYTIAYKR